jgi:hypothetical protein
MPSDNELLKMRSGGAITPKEYERLMAMPHADRYRAMDKKSPRQREMVKPEKAAGGPPKMIGEAMGSPGGPYTPGAKLERQKAAAAALRADKNRALKRRSGAAVTPKEIKKKDGKPSNPHRGAYSTGGTVSGAVGGGT